MIDYSKFRSSLKRLEEQHRNYQQGNPLLSELDREGIAEIRHTAIRNVL